MLRKNITCLNDWIIDDNRKPILLRGARQVGKSTLVRQFALSKGLQLYEVNLEKHLKLKSVFASMQVKEIIQALEGVLSLDIQVKGTLLFIDEVQAIPEALAALRYFYEDMPELAVIAAGSLVDFALADHSFSMPVGRIEYMHVHPMSFGEVLLNSGNEWLYKKWSSYVLGDPWPQSTHDQLLVMLRDYMLHGGMPAVVKSKLSGKGPKAVSKNLDSIQDTYRDDFAKYASRAQTPVLQLCYERLPTMISQKMKYSSISPDIKAAMIKNCIQLLNYAGILRKVHHSSCSGIPLGAHKDSDIYKIFWLDIGLLNRALGLSTQKTAIQFIHEGVMAEQFICQQLTGADIGQKNPELYYWMRDGQKQNAEIDFALQIEDKIIPIEVKSGKAGRLRSLHQFMMNYRYDRAVKFSGTLPSVVSVKAEPLPNQDVKAHEYTLVELPLYFAERIHDILSE